MATNWSTLQSRWPGAYRPSRLIRYGIAVLLIMCVSWVIHYLPVIAGWKQGALTLFLFANVMVNLFLGLFPGLLSLILSLIGLNLFLLNPIWHSAPESALFLNIDFCVLTLIVMLLFHYYHRHNQIVLESQQDLALAQEVAQVGSWRFKVKNDEVHWTDEKYRIFEIPLGTKITIDTFLSAIHPEDRDYVDRMWQASLRGAPYDIEHRIIVSGDKVKWIREKAILEFAKNGALLGGFGTTQDISVLKKSALALQTLNQRYELVLQGAQDGIWDWDLATNRVHYSDRWKTLRGYSIDEDLHDPSPWRDNIHPDDEDRVMAAMEKHLAAETPVFQEEYRIRCKDGAWKWILDRGLAERDEKGNVIRMAGTESDISVRKNAELELLQRDQELDLIMNLTPNLVAYLNTDFRYVRINKTYETWWHKSPEQILGHEVREIVGDQTWLDIKPYLQQVLSGEAVSYDYHSPSGRWVHVDYVPDVAPSGEVKGIVVNVANITEQKLVEQRLIDQEKQLGLIMNLVPALICYLDTDLKYQRVNERYQEWYGLSASELVGQKVQDILHEQTWVLAKPCLDLALEGESTSFEGLGVINGIERWLKASYVPDFDDSGRVKGIVVHVADITHQKHQALALIEKENFLSLIINAMPALVAYVDTDFRYVRANKTFEKWLNIPVEKIIGSKVKEIIGDTGWQKIKPYMELAMRGDEVHYDFLMPYKTGKTRWIHANYVPDFDPSGRVQGIITLVVDISEMTEAQEEIATLNEELQQRVEEVEAILAAAPIGLAITETADGKHIRGNKAMEQMIGLPAHSELSLRVKEPKPYKVYHDGRELAVEELPMQRAVRGKNVWNLMLEILRTDGKMVSVLSNAVPIMTKTGSPRGAVGAFLDITVLKNVEAALMASEERLRLAQNAGALGVYDHNLVTGDLEWDQRILDIWGLHPKQRFGIATFLKAIHPNDYERVKATVKSSLDPKGKGEYHAEYRVIRSSDQRLIWVSTYGIVRFKDNKAIRLVGYIQDITERKQAEFQLLETEARLALALKELNAGYWDWNLETNEVFLSPEWKHQLGYSDSEVPNLFGEWESRLHPEDKADALAKVKRYLNGEMTDYELEFRLRHKDGSYRWILSKAALIQYPGKRLAGIHLDITNYKQANELNQQRNRMEAAFRFKVASHTAAAIAHELNQPLTAISYFADVAVDMLKAGNQSPEKLAALLGSCSEQAQRAGETIKQLMSALEKGDVKSEQVDMNKIVRTVHDLLKSNNELNSFGFEMNLATELPRVIANKLQIQKVLVNLIRNSLDAIQEAGKDTGTVSVTTRLNPDNPSWVQVTVKDNGAGVADNSELNKLFKPFYSKKAHGLGMGLAISRSLIEAYGGKMWAEQNPDHGISVHFTLPLGL